MDKLYSTGDMIRRLRQKHGWTQEELGEKLGVKKSSIQKYETNSIRNLKLDVIKNLCSIFNVPPGVIIFPELAKEKEAQLNEITNENNINIYIDCMFSMVHLNSLGKQRALQYIKDLSMIDYYRK